MTIRDPHRQTPHFIRQLCLAILHRSRFDLGALWDCYCAAFVRSGRQQVGGGPGIALFRINPFSCLCLLLWIFLMFLLPWVRLCSLTPFSFFASISELLFVLSNVRGLPLQLYTIYSYFPTPLFLSCTLYA